MTDKDQEIISSISEDIIKTPARKLKFHLLKIHMYNIDNKYDEIENEIKKTERILNSLPEIKKIWFFYFKLTEGEFYTRVNDYPLAVHYLNELEYKAEHEKELESKIEEKTFQLKVEVFHIR